MLKAAAVVLTLAVATVGLHSPAAAAAAPQLIDQSGRRFTLQSLRGRPVIVTFVSAHCTDACPLVDAQFAAAAQEMARRHLSARLLTITLDPKHDSPKTMRALAKRFDANPHYWLVAGGRTADVLAVMQAFGVVAPAGDDDRHESHSTFVYVVDGSGRLQKTMLASTGLTGDVVSAARSLEARR
jgi:protein SCO1/2